MVTSSSDGESNASDNGNESKKDNNDSQPSAKIPPPDNPDQAQVKLND